MSDPTDNDLQVLADCTACGQTVIGGSNAAELEWDDAGNPYCAGCYAMLPVSPAREVVPRRKAVRA